MGLELKEELERYLARGNKVGPMPDGPLVETRNPLDLAQAIEHEAHRAASQGMAKLRLDMPLEDAHWLAKLLRRAALLGA